jgi:hypothetical protein
MNEEETVESQAEPEAPKAPDLLSIIQSKPGGPSKQVIDTWKAKHGAIYASGFSEEELYIWRAISRNEYKKIQIEGQEIAQMPVPAEAMAAQMASEEKIVSMCILWPAKTAEELAADKGGTVPTLLEQIMQNSNFMTPQQASYLVVKL